MDTELAEQIRASLLEKRTQVQEWLEKSAASEKQLRLGPADEGAVQTHLECIDQALDKADSKELGICAVCQGEIEAGLLEMDYTAAVCLEDLSNEEKRGLERELELAQSVQRSLLPQELPDTPYLELAAFSRPAQMVGGDYFDFFQFRDGAQGLAIADVAGHGISASLHMASIQTLLRTLIPSSDSPQEVVEHVHRLLIHNVRFDTFVTLFLASYNPETQIFIYCNAGHNPPLLLRQDKNQGDSATWLWPTGPAVGLVEQPPMQQASVALQPGDILVLYTDGVTEAMNAANELFGAERLEGAVRRGSGGAVKEIIRGIRQELVEFSHKEYQEDDITILACRVLG
jgi:sigma-B regulation protein RsbU (phosphoserine phosphatase)